MPITVLIADDHQLFRAGLISLLKEEPTVQVVSETKDGAEMIDAYKKFKPDVLLVDINMPKKSGLEAVKQLNAVEDVTALFLSMFEGEEYVYHCYQAGGKGLIGKNCKSEELVKAIQFVQAGEVYFTFKNQLVELDTIIKKYDLLFKKNKISGTYSFTPREEEILACVGMGYESKAIAERLGISKRTIDSHRRNLMNKLKIKTLPEFIRYAVQFTSREEED